MSVCFVSVEMIVNTLLMAYLLLCGLLQPVVIL